MKHLTLLLIAFLGISEVPAIKHPVSAPYPEIVQLKQNHPQVSVRINYYPIYGSTVQQIRDSLRTRGVVSPKNGKRYFGFTHWYVQWRYNYQQQKRQCRLTKATVTTTITITLPQWQIPSNTPNHLRLKWNQFSQALRKHEENHQRHGILAGQEILTTLHKLPPSPTCPQLEQKANQTAQSIIKKYNQADIHYDRQTQHGATEGAIF